MTNIVSNKKLLANRENALRSTGPTTPQGKAASARNALKHGLLARAVVIDGPRTPESKTDFDALLRDLIQELQPQDLIEESLVERIAVCYWRLRRAQRFETGALRDALETPDAHDHALQKTRQTLAKTDQDLARDRRLAELLAKPDPQRTPAETEELNFSMEDFAEDHRLHNLGIYPRDYPDRIPKELPRIIRKNQLERTTLAAELEAAQRDHVLREARRPLLLALPPHDQLHSLVRYEIMLDRQLHRAFAELRRRRTVSDPVASANKNLPNEPT